ncbi:MAG TPA: PQQ-binding-like beta-propeller repeat protein [Planctomycetaceae bacterium]|jgi:Ca-activated chloride channel family protein
MNRFSRFAFVGASIGLGLFSLAVMTLGADKQTAKKSKVPAKSAATNARRGRADPGPLELFKSPDGKHNGWKVKLSGGRRLATPAFAEGKLFLGGGFGSHEFYALDAETGRIVWQYDTKDDGPTAAVVADGYVGFNTESCELEILDLAGKPVWKKWLGDPLMSIPAIADGMVYMAYPDSKGAHDHKLACFDLKTGDSRWENTIPGEIITAPVVQDDRVYAASLEGTLSCFDSRTGNLLWSESKNATSSPVVWKDRCLFSRRTETKIAEGNRTVKQQSEQIASRGTGNTDSVRDIAATSRTADYLDYSKRAKSRKETAAQKADDGVGFGGAFKGGGKISQAMSNLGQASVCGVWSYQGSKPFIYRERLYAAMADKVVCVDPATEKLLWEKKFHSDEPGKRGGTELLDAALSPPALVNGKMFLGTSDGSVLCLSAETGDLLWRVNIGESIAFQPAVAGGRVFVATESGSLFGIKTGDSQDDGWFMWGANAAHTGSLPTNNKEK